MSAFTPEGGDQGKGAVVFGADRGEEMTRSSFLKLAFAAVPGAAVLFAAGCGGEQEEEEEEEDD